VSQEHHPGALRAGGRRRARVRAATTATTAAVAALLLSGCGDQIGDPRNGYLPGTDATSSINETVRSLWVGSWVAALAVGVIVWGLTIWCVVRYRRRKGDTGLPPQLRYNVPLEVLYTIVPLLMVGVLFYYTARDQKAIETRYEDPAVNIEVVGKRWAWDFNYLDADVYETSRQVDLDGGLTDDEIEASIPVLYMPVGQSAEITIRSRDVGHAFYVPEFNYKKDMIPGQTNYMSVTPGVEGLYKGKCAELCGQFHQSMLFNVAVVSQEEFDAQMAALRERGQTGALEVDLGPSDLNADLTEDEVGEDGGEEEEQS
jgi:cytochrome c oxidase subunit 2